MGDTHLHKEALMAKTSAISPTAMQEPLIQKILNLTKYTFARQPTTKPGCRERIHGTDIFSEQVSKLEALVKQVRYGKLFKFINSNHLLYFSIYFEIFIFPDVI